VLAGVPLIHPGQYCQDIEILVRDYRGNFNNHIAVGVEPGHLQIDPYQVHLVFALVHPLLLIRCYVTGSHYAISLPVDQY